MNPFKNKNPWPIGLTIFLILFGLYIAGYIAFASYQRMDLVRDDYYDQEIRFQQQIDRVKRTDPVMAAAGITYVTNQQSVTVTLPASVPAAEVSGTITFYRPSDAALDQNLALTLDSGGSQHIAVAALARGLWKVRVQWKVADQEYYFEKPVVLRPATAS